jgi:uncharacterized protein (TIGR02996 family)
VTRNEAFLAAIAEDPDDDAARLVYADWLDEHGGPGDAARAEFIRVQCALAALAEDDPRREDLAPREGALLAAHRADWTDLAFADWLGHRKRDCRNPEGHDFCTLVAEGVRTRCERDRLPPKDPRRRTLSGKLTRLGRRMENEFNYLPATCETGLFDEAEFHRGFVEKVTVQDYAVVLYAEALPRFGVLRDLDIENDSVADMGDRIIRRLAPVLDKLSLRSLDCHESLPCPKGARLLAKSRGLRRLESLNVWFEGGDNGDEAVALLAASPHLTNLRSLVVEHSEVFTDRALLTILDSPTLSGLTKCWLRHNAPMTLSEPVLRRWEARFGPLPETSGIPRTTVPAADAGG